MWSRPIHHGAVRAYPVHPSAPRPSMTPARSAPGTRLRRRPHQDFLRQARQGAVEGRHRTRQSSLRARHRPLARQPPLNKRAIRPPVWPALALHHCIGNLREEPDLPQRHSTAIKRCNRPLTGDKRGSVADAAQWGVCHFTEARRNREMECQRHGEKSHFRHD